MFSYSNPAFVDVEARYRRERLAQDWSPRRGAALDALVAGRGHVSVAAAPRSGRTLGRLVRHHRHA